MTAVEVDTAANGHEGKVYALPRTFAPFTDDIAEPMGSGERIIQSVAAACPPELHEEARADLIRMVEAWRWRGQE